MNSTVHDRVCLVCTCRCWWGCAQKMGHRASLLCFWCDLPSVRWNLWGQRQVIDKERHEVTFPHSDVTACENPVTNPASVSAHFGFLPISIFGSFALPPPLSVPPDQTLSCVTDTFHYLSLTSLVTGSTLLAQTFPEMATENVNNKSKRKKKALSLVYVVSTSPSLMKRQFSCNTEECFCFLSGCCCFDPCRPYWQLVVLVLHQLKHISLFCNMDKERMCVVYLI